MRTQVDPTNRLTTCVRARDYPHSCFRWFPSLSCSAVPACPAVFRRFPFRRFRLFRRFPAVSFFACPAVSGGFRRFPAFSGGFKLLAALSGVSGVFRRSFPAAVSGVFRRRFPAVFSGDLCATSVGRAVRGRRVMCGMAAVDVNYSIVYAPKVRGGRTTVLNIW